MRGSFPYATSWIECAIICKWLCRSLVLRPEASGPNGLGGRNNWPGYGLPRYAEEQILKCALSRWIVPVCYWNCPEMEREMFSLISAGLTFCQLRGMRKEKRDCTCLVLPFMVPGEVCPDRMAWVILIGWNVSFQNSNGKTIPALNNGLQSFLLHFHQSV